MAALPVGQPPVAAIRQGGGAGIEAGLDDRAAIQADAGGLKAVFPAFVMVQAGEIAMVETADRYAINPGADLGDHHGIDAPGDEDSAMAVKPRRPAIPGYDLAT